MVLPDVQDSGKCPVTRSHFSQTCSLLSKYMKEKGAFPFPDLKLSLTTNFESSKGPQYNTVNLLGGVGNETEKKFEAGSGAQMTIFYGGQVIVFDDIPADKAKQIVMLATKASFISSLKPTESTVSVQNSPALGSDLPIARKKSISRFLEKRKDRVIGYAPYPTSKPAAVAPLAKDGKAWLGMAPSLGQWSSGH